MLLEDFEPANGFSHDHTIHGINGWMPGQFLDPCAIKTRESSIAFNVKDTLAAQAYFVGAWGSIKKQFPIQMSGVLEASYLFNESGNNGNGGVVCVFLRGPQGAIYASVWPGPSYEWLSYTWTDGAGNEVIGPAPNEQPSTTFSEIGFPSTDRTAWYEYKITYNIDADRLSLDIRPEDGQWTNILTAAGPGVPVHPTTLEIQTIRFGSGNSNPIAIDNVKVENLPVPEVCGDPGTVYMKHRPGPGLSCASGRP